MNEVNRKALKEEEKILRELLAEEHDEVMLNLRSINRKLNKLERDIKKEKEES